MLGNGHSVDTEMTPVSSSPLNPGSHTHLPCLSSWHQQSAATRSTNLATRLRGSKHLLCFLQTVRSWKLYFLSLCCSYLICKPSMLLPTPRVLRGLTESLDINYLEQRSARCKWSISVRGYRKLQNGTIGLPIPHPLPSQAASL